MVRLNGATLIFLLPALGVVLIVMGGFIQSVQYISDLLLSAGATIALVSPLFAAERSLEKRLRDIAQGVADLRLLVKVDAADPSMRSVREVIARYSASLTDFGLPSAADVPTIKVSTNAEDLSYNPINHQILVAEDYRDDANAILVQYTHHIMQSLPDRAQPDIGPGGLAVCEGLAWTLVCSFTEDPIYRHPARGTVDLRVVRRFVPADQREFFLDDYNYAEVRELSAKWATLFWRLLSLHRSSRSVCTILISSFSLVQAEYLEWIWSNYAYAMAFDARWGQDRPAVLDIISDHGLPILEEGEEGPNGQTTLFDL